jgi:hypothetical protein
MSGSTRVLGVIITITIAMLLTGIILIVIDFPNSSLPFFLALVGGMLSFVLLPCYLAKRSLI